MNNRRCEEPHITWIKEQQSHSRRRTHLLLEWVLQMLVGDEGGSQLEISVARRGFNLLKELSVHFWSSLGWEVRFSRYDNLSSQHDRKLIKMKENRECFLKLNICISTANPGLDALKR